MRTKIKILSNKIKEYREKHGLSIANFARLAKVSGASIYRYESGYPYATIQTVKNISKALGIKEKDLVANPEELQPVDIASIDTLGGRVKALRNDRGMSQFQLAKKVGIAISIIYKIESGITKNSKYIGDIAKVLGVSLLELYKGLPTLQYSNTKKEVEIKDTKETYYANRMFEDSDKHYYNPQVSYNTRAVVIGIQSFDGDLLNDINRKLNIMHPEVEGYLVVREIKNSWTMFVIGRKLYDMTVNEKTILDATKYLLEDIEVDSAELNSMSIFIFGGFDNPIFHVHGNERGIEASVIGNNGYFVGHYDLNEAIGRMRATLDNSVGIGKYQIASYSNKDTIVEMYVSGVRGEITDNIYEAAYRFLDKGVDHSQIVSYIRDIIMINSVNRAISTAKALVNNPLENRFNSMFGRGESMNTSSKITELFIVVVDKHDRYNNKKYSFIIL